MFKFLRSKKGQGMVEYGLIICAVAIAAIIGLNSLGQNNADRTMEIAETLEDANASYEAEQKDMANKESIGNFNSGNGGYYSGGGGGGLGSFPSYSGGVNWRPATNPDGTTNTNDRIGTIDDAATEDAPVLNDDAPEGNQAPIASFYVSNQNNIRVGQSLTFYNTSSDPDGDRIVKEEWQGIPPGNKFTIVGEYEVKLRVVDEWGNWSQWATVILEVGNHKPIAIITSSPDFDNGDEFDKTQIFQWSSTASYDPDNHRIVDEEWRGQSNYYEAGEHTIELRVKDEFDTWSNWVSKTFTIYNGSKPVIVSGTLSDAKNGTWSTNLLMQGQEEIPELLSGKDIYFKSELVVRDEDRDTIKAIQYRVDGTSINPLYNTQNRGSEEEKEVTSSTSPGVPFSNSLSAGTHSVEIRVQDYNGAWSDWTAPIYIKVLDVKGEDQDAEVEYITMDIFNFNTTSNSAFGGNRGPWYAGNFIIIPQDQTNSVLKDAVVMIDDVEIESTFEIIAGIPSVKFNYNEVGSHTIKVKFQDENDIWSNWVENASFNLREANITFRYDTNYEDCSYNCNSWSATFDTTNTGATSTVNVSIGSYYDYSNYFYYQNPTGGNISYINVKINDVITKWENISFYNDSTGDNNVGDSVTGFYGIFQTHSLGIDFLNEDKTVSFQAVDTNGISSAWTNEVTFTVGTTEELPDTVSIEEIIPPYTSTYDGWNVLFTDYDDDYGLISLPAGKTITFGGNEYSSLYVNSNGSIKFGAGNSNYGGDHVSSNNSTTNSIVLIGNQDLDSSVYYKHTATGIDIMFMYCRHGAGSKDKIALASINFDGTGSIHFVGEQDEQVINSTNKTFIKTETGNYHELTNAVAENKSYNWTKNTSGTNPYYTLEETAFSQQNFDLGETRTYYPIYINGSKIQTTLYTRGSSELVYPYYVYEFNGSITFKDTTTGTEYTGTYTAYNDYGSTGTTYYTNISDIPGLTPGEYEMVLNSANIVYAEGASSGSSIKINAEPIIVTLTEQAMNINSISYSYSTKAHQLYFSTNNYGSSKDLLEIKIDDVDFTQKSTEEEATATENSFKFTETTSSALYAYFYNTEIFTPGSTHTVKARFRISGTELWSSWKEAQFTVPALSVSSVSVTATPSKNISTLTVNLSNYTGKYPVGVKVEIDGTLYEDTSLTTTTLTNSFISKFTKEIPLLTVGSHTIKTTVLYKTSEYSETVYETSVKTTSYTQGNYEPTISGMSKNSSYATYQSFKITYNNPYNVGMYTHKHQLYINDVDVSAYITHSSSSSTYAYINIPNEYLSEGTNSFRIKTFYRTSNNTLLEYKETNEYTYTYSYDYIYFDSLSVNTSSTTTQDLYLNASFTNPLYKSISDIIIKVNGEVVDSTITSSGTASATIKINTPQPTGSISEYTITAIATIGGSEYENTITYTIKSPSNSPRTSLTHENITTTAQEYIWFYIYTDVKNEIKPEELTLQYNGENMIIDRISTSWSSGSYSTDNGTMKYRGKVSVYLGDYYYRPGAYSFTASLNYSGTELNYSSSGTYSTMGTISNYIYANTKEANKLKLYLQYYSSGYYRVKELKIKEYTDSSYETLIRETTTALKDGESYYYYVGATSREFEAIDFENPNQKHYFKLSFVTPWGFEGPEKQYVLEPVETPNPILTPTYYSNGQFKTTFSTNIFNVTKSSELSGLELKINETIYPYTVKTATLANQGSTTSRSYLQVQWQNTTNNDLITPVFNSDDIDEVYLHQSLTKNMQYRIKYSDDTYSDWFDINNKVFEYPWLYEISAVTTENKIVNDLYVTSIHISGNDLTSTETFTPTIYLDGIEQEVVNTTCDIETCVIDIIQPENGIYNELTVALSYSAYDTTISTGTISKNNVVIYNEIEVLENTIAVTKTPNTTFPSYSLSDFTKVSSEIGTTPVKINLNTPVSFYGETINTLSVNRGVIGFGEFASLSTVLLRTDTETQIRNNHTRIKEMQVAFFPSTYNIKNDAAFENSGIYYKEDASKVTILYKDAWMYYFFYNSSTQLPIENTPHFDIYIEIDKATGSGNIYFSDMNKENNATIQEYLEGTSENITSTKQNQAKYPRTLFVKHNDSHYGYLEPINEETNIDLMYSNTMFSWFNENQVEPPVINSATIQKVINDDTPVVMSEVIDFGFTGSVQEYTLPAGTHTIEVWGAQGGNAASATYAGGTGGLGGYSVGEITLNQPTTYQIVVGGQGQSYNPDYGIKYGGAGGFGAGGAGGQPWMSGNVSGGAGGGGLSGVFTSTSYTSSAVIIAGGGGGAGGSASSSSSNHGAGTNGGYGGGTEGGKGVHTLSGTTTVSNKSATNSGNGGTQSAGGAVTNQNATAGGLLYGGGGGGNVGGNIGNAATLTGGLGSTSANTSNSAGGSGGGGGGYYGGSGGGQYGVGGGGGSGYVNLSILNSGTTYAGNTTFSNIAGTGEETGHSGNGHVKITTNGLSPEQTEITINFTSRSNTTTVRSAKLMSNTGRILTEEFNQSDNNTIVFAPFTMGANIDYIYAWIELDDGLYSNNKKINLNKVNIINATINNNNNSEYTEITFNIDNIQNTNVIDVPIQIVNNETKEEIALNIISSNITNSNATIRIDKLPQSEYTLKANVEYYDYGITTLSKTFTKSFDTYVSDLTSTGIKPTMEPTTFPDNLTTSTSGYSTLYSNTDDSYSSISAASGKKFKFGNKEYNQIYVNSNGSIRFDSGTSARGSSLYYTNSSSNNSIVLLGGYDLKSYVYYKKIDEGVEVLYKYTQYGSSSFNYWMKALIRYNGTGEIYFIGTPNSSLISSATTFVKTDANNYDLEIASGSGTIDKYTNKAYKYYFGASSTDIPTITNLSVNQPTLNGGKTATLTITTDKPITAADIYVGSSNLKSVHTLNQTSDYVYTTEISIPNNNATSTIPIKVSAYYLNAQSYWKEINVPYAKSPAPEITNVTGINSSFKEGYITNATINYNTSTLNSSVEDISIKYVDENGERDISFEEKEILASTINVTGIDFSALQNGSGNIVISIKDSTNIYSDDYIIPVTITQNEAPVITNVSIPLNSEGKLSYKKKLTFTINYEDVENDQLTYVYYRTKTATGSWSSTTNIALPNDSVEVVDANTIKVTINGYSNSDLTLDYEFSIKDSFYKSEPVIKTYNLTQNIAPEITELVSQTETSVGSTIELSALYTDYEEEYSPSTIQDIYVYVDGELTELYQNAYASNNTIKVRNLLLDSAGLHTIGLMAKDTYGKTTNLKEVQVNVIPSTSPVLFSYEIEPVVLDRDITLKNISYENSERGNGIEALEYSIDGASPVVVEFENTITENNFSYTLPTTAYDTPDTEIKYIFVRIKDTTGNWSTSLMGTFTVGYINQNGSENSIYIDSYDYLYSQTFGDYSPVIDINDTIRINYIYGRYTDDMEIIPVIDGIETPSILNDYYKPNNSTIEYINLSFDNIEIGQHKIEILIRNKQSSYSYNFGTFEFADVVNTITFVPIQKEIKGTTNTNIILNGYLATTNYDYIYLLEDYSYNTLKEAINIAGVDPETYTITRTNISRDYYMTFYVSYTLNFSEPISNNYLQITQRLVEPSAGTDSSEEIIETTPTVNIPIEIAENSSNLTSDWTITLNSFVNTEKTIKNAVLAGNLKFAINYKVTNPTANIEAIKLYIDGEEHPIDDPRVTEGTVNTNYKSGVISATFFYENLGLHTFEIVATTNSNEELRYSIEKNLVHKANPAFEVRDGSDTVVPETTLSTLVDGNPILTFNFTDDSGTIYSKQQIIVNNIVYDFPGEKTIDFGRLQQGYYNVKILLESDYETITKFYYILDPGVTKVTDTISMGDGRRVTIPNSIYLFGQTYNALYIEPSGSISPTTPYIANETGEITNISYYNRLILPVQSYDDWDCYSGHINKVFYKNFIDNLTLYIDAVDPYGNRIYYSVAFYNRDVLKFNYYIVENSLAEKQLAGVSYDSDSFVVTNTSATGLKDNTTVTIDTYRMLAN